MAFARLEPFGEQRADLRAAIIASTVANAGGGRGEGKPPFDVADFMPHFEQVSETAVDERDEISADELEAYRQRQIVLAQRMKEQFIALGGVQVEKGDGTTTVMFDMDALADEADETVVTQ